MIINGRNYNYLDSNFLIDKFPLSPFPFFAPFSIPKHIFCKVLSKTRQCFPNKVALIHLCLACVSFYTQNLKFDIAHWY